MTSPQSPEPFAREVASYADRIEGTMREIGAWQEKPLEPEQYEFRAAFAMDTMAFTQWLQFIFLPRVREAVEAGHFPSESHVGAQAVREFDGWNEASPLVTLLNKFDSLFAEPSA